MPTILDAPPANVQTDLESLRNALDGTIPAKEPGGLLIATWNLRMFGSLTRKWTAEAGDNPKRDLRGLRTIGEIVSRLDVVAIQEVMGDLRALRDLVQLLGERWAFLMTDVTRGKAGNHERMAFLFDLDRVKPSGLACELVVPPEWEAEIEPNALRRQFARTPYAVSFKAGGATFILVTLHVEYGEDSADRVPELQGIARWMAEWAAQENRWHHNLLTLGDFNIDRRDDDLWKAFTSTGLQVPGDLVGLPRTIFSDPGSPDTEKFYDQIAWFQEDGRRLLSMEYVEGGSFDFLPHVYTDTNLSRNSISHRVSDHYPLWARFRVPGSSGASTAAGLVPGWGDGFCQFPGRPQSTSPMTIDHSMSRHRRLTMLELHDGIGSQGADRPRGIRLPRPHGGSVAVREPP